MDKLLKILKELRPEVDFETQTKLIDEGILDSFDMVSLIGEINDVFHIEIDFEDIEPENFNSAHGMYELICRLQNGV